MAVVVSGKRIARGERYPHRQLLKQRPFLTVTEHFLSTLIESPIEQCNCTKVILFDPHCRPVGPLLLLPKHPTSTSSSCYFASSDRGVGGGGGVATTVRMLEND